MSWPTHKSSNEYYLEIGNNLVGKNGLNVERYKVWDELEVSSGTRISMALAVMLLSLYLAFNYVDT